MPRAHEIAFDVIPDIFVRLTTWSQPFQCARCKDGRTVNAHEFAHAVNDEPAIEGMSEEVGIDER